ncbi:MAG: modulator protein [Phenylobacterium sp. RIFCSPHIGHO2_01_FULL_69_31]|uniref:TldD/PmbA family protein n=1 Tax=Phenylobacterium sp. RIFCSPHIGHO2_01_FULL_69_31 TaxID=1801944 RepID=UPI0008ACA60F|nr:TldD/PmbA family protein [Phenylobacterium sp. RIFCSPHIGHO2_01_FULL_69_31]OHB29261.1 MAG: modulator protein [Phenylobacterium sp. RIFCSPHIGHO2_01_FULL_69_31]
MDETLLNDVVAAALRAGADAAEAVGAERRSLSITVRTGELEEVEREESRDLGLRVFVGKRQATVSGSDISPEARAKLVERAVAMARLAPEDPYAGLADPAHLARGPRPDLDLFDPAEPTPESLEERARIAEAAARAVPRVTNSDGGSGSWSASQWTMVTSGGFTGVHRASGFHIGASAIAGDGETMETGYDGRSTRWQSDLPSPEALGAEAGRRAAQRLGARKIASTTAPVIFENRLAGSLMSPLIGAISGPSIARGTSFLKDKLGEQIFAKGVHIVDDPHRPRGLGSSPFDDEGVANEKRHLIDDGVLTTWLLNSASARQLGLTTTGHASRGLAGPPGVSTSNLTFQPGEKDQAELMRDAGAGLLITSMFGPSLNGNTGDWSVGCSGFWFENGVIAYPVNEITVAGNLLDIFGRIVPGSDLEIRGSANAPSLLVDALAIAGR